MFQFARFSYLFLFLALTLLACDTESADNSNTAADQEGTTTEEPAQKTGEDLFNELKAKAVDVNDVKARLANSAAKMEPILRGSAERVPAFKNAKVSMEKESTLRLKTDTKEYVVDMRTFDSERIGLIPDQTAEDLPGVRLRTIDDTKSVQVYENGTLLEETNELVVFLATRKDVENLTPILVQMIYLSQGRLE
ncbi:MAG: hypothetical protein AAGH79_12995 [Bacteroidota bacterium]